MSLVIDSSGWLEFFTKGRNAPHFGALLASGDQIAVPSVVIYEVAKLLARQFDERSAAQAVAVMEARTVVDLDVSLALDAARLSLHHRLPMADSIILATARRYGATLWTQDADFDGLAGVRYIAKA